MLGGLISDTRLPYGEPGTQKPGTHLGGQDDMCLSSERGARDERGCRAAGNSHCQGSGSDYTKCRQLLTAEDEQLRQKEKSSGLTVSPVTLYHLTQLAQMTGI